MLSKIAGLTSHMLLLSQYNFFNAVNSFTFSEVSRLLEQSNSCNAVHPLTFNEASWFRSQYNHFNAVHPLTFNVDEVSRLF